MLDSWEKAQEGKVNFSHAPFPCYQRVRDHNTTYESLDAGYVKPCMLDILEAVEHETVPLLDNEDESARRSFSVPLYRQAAAAGRCNTSMNHEEKEVK